MSVVGDLGLGVGAEGEREGMVLTWLKTLSPDSIEVVERLVSDLPVYVHILEVLVWFLVLV